MPHTHSTSTTVPAIDLSAYVERARDLAFRLGPVALALLSREGRIVHANRAYEQLFGWSAGELAKMTWAEFTHPEDSEIGVAAVAAVGSGEAGSATFEKRCVARGGRVLWARVTVFPVHDEAGRPLYTVATLHDVTDERVARRRADDWRRRYETAILASRQVLYDWDIANDRTVWAGACEVMLGRAAAELGDLPDWLDLIHPDDVSGVRAAVDDALAARRAVRAVYRVRHGAGHWIWVEDSGYFVVDDSGRLERMIGFVVDVTERVQAEYERRRREELFRLAATVMNGLVWEWDLATGVVWRSDGLRQLLGYAPDELPATPDAWHALVHPDDLARMDLHAVAPRLESEYRLRHRDGRWIVVWERAVVQGDVNGRPQRLVGSTVDITERRLAADEIRRLNADLEARVAARTAELTHTNRELEAFTYSVSHDLRAPLRHVAGFAELLRQRSAASLDPESARYLGLVLDSSARMGELLDRLLDLSHVGRAPLAFTAVDPAQVARELVAEFAAQHGDRAITWRIGAIPAVRADPALLRLVLSNLLHNALKYTAACSPAEIALRGRTLPGGLVELEVADNGVGFDMQYAHRLFGVFERLHPAGDFEGWGIGLASVQRVIARHGGTVAGRGEPGRGAWFSVTLPAAVEP